MGWHFSEDRFLGWDQNFPGYFFFFFSFPPSAWLLSNLLLFQTQLAFALLLWKPELVVWGKMCVHESAGGGGVVEVVAIQSWGSGHGHGVSEDSRKRQKSLWGPCPLGQWLFRELLISHGAHLGNRHLFVDLQGSPGSRPALQWNIWKALAPPCAKAAEPWRQRSMTSSWLLLNPCPRQAFFWEPVSNTDLWCQGLWAVAGRLSLLLDGWGQRKGLGRESSENLAFQEIWAQVGSPASYSLGFLTEKTASWATAWGSCSLMLGLILRVGVGLRLETNLVLTPAGHSCNLWEIMLKKHRVIFFFFNAHNLSYTGLCWKQ